MGSSKFITRQTQLHYLLSVDHNGMAVQLTRNDLKCCKKCCISNVGDGTDDDMLWNGSEDGDSDIEWEM